LKILNKEGIGPKFINYSGGKLFREFVEGEHIGKFLENETDAKKIISVIRQVLMQCRKIFYLPIVTQFQYIKVSLNARLLVAFPVRAPFEWVVHEVAVPASSTRS